MLKECQTGFSATSVEVRRRICIFILFISYYCLIIYYLYLTCLTQLNIHNYHKIMKLVSSAATSFTVQYTIEYICSLCWQLHVVGLVPGWLSCCYVISLQFKVTYQKTVIWGKSLIHPVLFFAELEFKSRSFIRNN